MNSNYNPVSPSDPLTLGETLAKYASKVWNRNPEIKYHSPVDCKRAIGYRLYESRDSRTGICRNRIDPIIMYKFETGKGYMQIFSSESELAAAFKRGELTRRELYDNIDW